MVDKSSTCLRLHRTTELDSDSDQDRVEAFPKSESHQTVFPFPKAFQSVFSQEWLSHSKGSGSRVADRLYTLPEKQMSLIRVPMVDAPVASLSSSSIPVDGDIWPKNPTDHKMEQHLKRNFEVSSFSFCAAPANSVMSQAAFIWVQEAARNKKLPKVVESTFKKIALASVFAADASLDSMRFSARAMSSNVSTRRVLWLRSWMGESGSHSKLVNLPFKGGKLFSKALDLILVEAKDKCKVLPPGKKDIPKSKQSSFRPFKPCFRDSSGSQFKSCWTNARVLPRPRVPNNNNRSQ